MGLKELVIQFSPSLCSSFLGPGILLSTWFTTTFVLLLSFSGYLFFCPEDGGSKFL
jgi:hypothetical protein